MAGWDDFLTERDKAVFPASGYGARGGFGSRPVVLIVDVNYAFCGERPEPILASVEEWPLSAGADAWDAVGSDRRAARRVARAKRVPVIYATSPSAGVAYDYGLGRWQDKNPLSTSRTRPPGAPSRSWRRSRRSPSELVIVKSKPSVFFGTELVSYLVDLGADTRDRVRRDDERLRARDRHRRVLLQLPHGGRRGVHVRPRAGVALDQPLRHGPEVRRRAAARRRWSPTSRACPATCTRAVLPARPAED